MNMTPSIAMLGRTFLSLISQNVDVSERRRSTDPLPSAIGTIRISVCLQAAIQVELSLRAIDMLLANHGKPCLPSFNIDLLG